MAKTIGTDNLPLDSDSMDKLCLIFRVELDEQYQPIGKVQFITNHNRKTGDSGRPFQRSDDIIEINEPIHLNRHHRRSSNPFVHPRTMWVQTADLGLCRSRLPASAGSLRIRSFPNRFRITAAFFSAEI